KRLSGKDFTLQEAALVLVESYHISQEQAERDVVIWADALKKCSALLD
ncbi:PqqD family protein, partial [Bacteroides xylanisolvens]